MKVLLQRVSGAKVSVNENVIGQIGRGFLLLVGVAAEDGDEQVDYMVEKIINLRIFEDEEGKFNHSLIDVAGELLVVSQFTLFADCSKGRRPSFIDAARPELAEAIYLKMVEKFRQAGVKKVETGQFQAHMQVVAALGDAWRDSAPMVASQWAAGCSDRLPIDPSSCSTIPATPSCRTPGSAVCWRCSHPPSAVHR